jgi:omega-6 fatty acid desaturase (delta-12 desaturase)
MNSPKDGKGADRERKSRLMRALAHYQKPSMGRSILQLANSMIPYLALWYLAYRLLEVSYWATLGVSVLAAGFLVRIFIISHDCGHGSLFKSRKANDIVGGVTSFLAFVPYYRWKREHSIHHASSGNLDNRGVGDIHMLTVEEYMALPRWRRIGYRLYRNPIVMFGVGPLYLFLIHYRFSPRNATLREKLSVIRTNVAIAAAITVMALTIGIKAFVLVQLPIIAFAATAGVWLFYVQHQYEGVYWERHENWDFLTQALEGSSFYRLPAILQWFSGNIGFHHIHHLSARIPNYYLERCQREVEELKSVRVLTLPRSFKSLAFRLWDEKRRRLVGFARVAEIRREQAASPDAAR